LDLSLKTVITTGFTAVYTVRPHKAHTILGPHIPKSNFLVLLNNGKWKRKEVNVRAPVHYLSQTFVKSTLTVTLVKDFTSDIVVKMS